jgi:hypothetical protein
LTSLIGKPDLLRTKTLGLRVGWRQDLYSPIGIGILWIEILKQEEYKLCPVPKKYFTQMLREANPEQTMNQLLRMYLKED